MQPTSVEDLSSFDDLGKLTADDLALEAGEPKSGEQSADHHRQTRSEFEALQLGTEYLRRSKGESSQRIRARFGKRDWTAITDFYPFSSGGLIGLYRFEDQLKSGRHAVLVYRSGWGGLLVAVPAILAAVLFLWLASGRSMIAYDVGEGRVEARSRDFWPLRGGLRHFARAEIEDVVVTSAPAHKGGTLYRPGFRLKSGELFAFGATGARSPHRAEYLVKQLRRLLEFTHGPAQDGHDPRT